MGAALRAAGRDVLALAEDASFEGLDDPLVLELAASQQRILVTRNSRGFAPLAREWAEDRGTPSCKNQGSSSTRGLGQCSLTMCLRRVPAARRRQQCRRVSLISINPGADVASQANRGRMMPEVTTGPSDP